MAKPIKWGPYLEPLREKLNLKFDQLLANSNICDTKFKLELELGDLFDANNGALILFKPEAYLKMLLTILESNKELAMHGLVTRDANIFTVHDVLMYPQEVTSTTVESADGEYGKWIAQIPDDKFNMLRFQMHSHVNMGANPSGTDHSFYRQLLNSVEDFYIFLIMNKRMEVWTNIYDVQNNILFEDKDVEYAVEGLDGNLIEDWVTDNITKYIQPRKTYVAPTTGAGGNVHDEKKTREISSGGNGKNTGACINGKRGPGRPRKDQPGNPARSKFWDDEYERQAAHRETGGLAGVGKPVYNNPMCGYGCNPCYECGGRCVGLSLQRTIREE